MAKGNFCGVPTVDISPYLADPKSNAARKIIEDVRDACTSTGFFQVTGHGISKNLQQNVFDAAHAFFALPLEEKKKLNATNFIGHRGYDVLASQSYEEGVLPDLKEVRNPKVHHCDWHWLCWPSFSPIARAALVGV